MPTEKELDIALAQALQSSPEFLRWFLGRTKFADRNAVVVNCRADNPWGTHPFPTKDPATGVTAESRRQSETDVLLILKTDTEDILGVHIENKIGSGCFTADQPEMYWHRAKHWVGKAHYGGYTDFDTVLIAPYAFVNQNSDQVRHFGSFISHEDIAAHIPLFGESC